MEKHCKQNTLAKHIQQKHTGKNFANETVPKTVHNKQTKQKQVDNRNKSQWQRHCI